MNITRAELQVIKSKIGGIVMALESLGETINLKESTTRMYYEILETLAKDLNDFFQLSEEIEN